MKKKNYLLRVAVLLAGLLALSGVAQSAMWVGAELGGNFPAASANTNLFGVSTSADLGFKPSVIGGAIIGYDFVNSGFGAYAWPDWMKYFSFATDITYNRLHLNNISNISIGQFNFPNTSVHVGVDGYCVAWTFLFMAHYGFMPDSEVPSGRINPYIGVGPAIVWSGFKLGAGFNTMNVALVVEPGIRWVALPNVSIDTAFRWRYCAPSYSFNNVNLNVNALNQFTFLVRANYHF